MTSRTGRLGPASIVIESLGAEDVVRHRPQLVTLLKDAVDSGASVGFLPPLAEAEGEAYWQTVAGAVREGSCVLVVARDAGDGASGRGEIVGTAQLLLATRRNALHRAEVAKVIVHTKARRRGIELAPHANGTAAIPETTPSTNSHFGLHRSTRIPWNGTSSTSGPLATFTRRASTR